MPKFERAERAIADFTASIVAKDYPELHELMTLDHENARQLAIDFIMVHGDEDENGEPVGPPAITHGGYPALALCRIINLRDRAMGRSDVEIQIDAGRWSKMGRHEQEALLAHEIHHILPKHDRFEAVKRDDLGRVELRLRKHDYQFGWFAEIARKYGPDSCEVKQAQLIYNQDGESIFPFMQLADAPH